MAVSICFYPRHYRRRFTVPLSVPWRYKREHFLSHLLRVGNSDFSPIIPTSCTEQVARNLSELRYAQPTTEIAAPPPPPHTHNPSLYPFQRHNFPTSCHTAVDRAFRLPAGQMSSFPFKIYKRILKARLRSPHRSWHYSADLT